MMITKILFVVGATAVLTSTGLAANYKALVKEGYRWAAADPGCRKQIETPAAADSAAPMAPLPLDARPSEAGPVPVTTPGSGAKGY